MNFSSELQAQKAVFTRKIISHSICPDVGTNCQFSWRHDKSDEQNAQYEHFYFFLASANQQNQQNQRGQIYGVRKPEEKQYLANFVFSNLSLMDKNLQISFHLIFDAIKKYQKDKNELPS